MPSTSFFRGEVGLAVASPGLVHEFLDTNRRVVEETLQRILPLTSDDDGGVAESMRYTVLAPGKRIRPLILLAVADLYQAERSRVLPSACAVELVHACSLILDDLPCMDNAELRRGRPSNHRVHGEATAILAAFGLLNLAYGLVAGGASVPDTIRAAVARKLSEALGTLGLIGGQALDLGLAAPRLDLHELERIHSRKTGSLFIASVTIGARLAGAPENEEAALGAFAKNLGLAYQIVDDLLDASGDPSVTGKDARADRRGNFVTLAGLEGARRLTGELSECAMEHLTPLGQRAALLRGLALELSGRAR